MPKIPPRKEQSGYPEPDTNTEQSRSRRGHKQSQQVSYDDEHPEIPRIRRASLYLDEFTYPSGPGHSSQPLEEDEEATHPLRESQRTRRERVEEDEQDWNDEAGAARVTNRITVTQRRSQNIYEPPPAARPRIQERHNPAGFLTRSRQKRPLLLIAVAMLLMLVCLSVISYGFQQWQKQITIMGSTGQSGTSGVKSDNPHALVITPSDTTHPAPPVYATEAYLLDANTGATLYAHNPFEHRPMLSTTKLMTALLAVERGNPDQSITINDAIARDINNLSADSSLMGIKKGETYTLRDLLYGAMLVSGNDAATAIADAIGGTEQNFVAEMNQRAHQLGLFDTHYMNPHGLLTDGHYSCAHDLAVLGKITMANALIHQITGTKEYHITASPRHADHVLINGNQFLWWYPGVDGGKPGWDGNTDFIQMVSVTRNGHHLIGVTMNTSDWWTDMRDLMNWGLNTFTWTSPYDVDLQHPIPYDVDWNYFTKDKKETTIPTADHGRYYVYTGYSVSGLIMQYFDQKGGLRQFGYPESLPTMANDTVVTERFDRGSLQCDTTTKACRLITT